VIHSAVGKDDPFDMSPTGRLGQKRSMRSSISLVVALAAGQVLSACASSGAHIRDDAPPLTVEQANANAPFLPPLPAVAMSGELASTGDPVVLEALNLQPVEWPIRFKKAINFGLRCVNTKTCTLQFDGMTFRRLEPVTFIGDPYAPEIVRGWDATRLSYAFDDPVAVSWRSLDGAEHRTVVELPKIFGGRQVLHVVPRDEVALMADGDYEHLPGILVEINDRSVHVYMRALIPTRHLQRPGRPLSNYRADLILARSYSF